MAEHLPFRRLRFRNSHDFQALQVSDLQIGAVSYRLNRLFDRQGAQEKTVRVHPPSPRILELRASSCIFRKKDGASPSIVFCRPLHYVSPDRFVFEVDEREPLPQAIGHEGFLVFLDTPRRGKLARVNHALKEPNRNKSSRSEDRRGLRGPVSCPRGRTSSG